MKKIIAFSIISAFAAVSVQAQNISFRIEKDFVTAAGSIINPSTPGATVLSATMSLSAFNALTFTTSDPLAFLSEIQALASAPTLNPWLSVPAASGPVANTNDWNSTRTALTPGSTPVMLILTSPLAELTTGDYVGLVASSTLVPDAGSLTVNFTGVNQWDNLKLGSSGSLVLVAVPEPSTFALLGGVLALGFVMYRRRRA